MITNTFLIKLELIVIVLPVSLILSLTGIPIATQQLLGAFGFGTSIIFTIAIFSVISVISILIVSLKHLKSLPVVNFSHAIYWVSIFGGVIIVLASYLSQHLPDSIPFAGHWSFYDDLRAFVMGAPLIIPAFHVLLSAYFSEKR